MNPHQKKTNRQARPPFPARLFLILCAALCAGILGAQGADYLSSLSRERLRFPADAQVIPVSSPLSESVITRLNSAGSEDFQRASGIGPALAQAILDYREEIGGFFFIEELTDVSGIGQKRFEALRALFADPALP